MAVFERQQSLFAYVNSFMKLVSKFWSFYLFFVSFTSCTPIPFISPSHNTHPPPLQHSLQQKKKISVEVVMCLTVSRSTHLFLHFFVCKYSSWVLSDTMYLGFCYTINPGTLLGLPLRYPVVASRVSSIMWPRTGGRHSLPSECCC